MSTTDEAEPVTWYIGFCDYCRTALSFTTAEARDEFEHTHCQDDEEEADDD